MNILEFFGSVWLAIAVGVFFIAMVIGCSFDRGYSESPKWWVFFIGLGVIATLSWKEGLTAGWMTFEFWRPMLTLIGTYLLIGLGYSMIEFILVVRKATRYWTPKWEAFKKESKADFKKNWLRVAEQKSREEYLEAYVKRNSDGSDAPRSSFKRGDELKDFVFNPSQHVPPAQDEREVMAEFVGSARRNGYDESRRIIGVQLNEEGTNIEPQIRKSVLAEHIGVWTIFWPFYLVSLIIGDLLVEVFEWIAEFVAGLSGRFVKMAFRDVFKF